MHTDWLFYYLIPNITIVFNIVKTDKAMAVANQPAPPRPTLDGIAEQERGMSFEQRMERSKKEGLARVLALHDSPPNPSTDVALDTYKSPLFNYEVEARKLVNKLIYNEQIGPNEQQLLRADTYVKPDEHLGRLFNATLDDYLNHDLQTHFKGEKVLHDTIFHKLEAIRNPAEPTLTQPVKVADVAQQLPLLSAPEVPIPADPAIAQIPSPLLTKTDEADGTYQPISLAGFTVGYKEKPGDLTDADTRTETIEFRFEPTRYETPLNQPGGSDVEALRVAEQLQASEFELLLPSEAEHLRGYLQNDGYLSNEEISLALYDARLTRDELAHKVDLVAERSTTKPDEAIKEALVEYLWAIHETIKDSPFMALIDPKATYQFVGIEPLAIATKGEKVADEGAKKKAKNDEGVIRHLFGFKVFDGGMMANFIHNKDTAEKLIDNTLTKLFSLVKKKDASNTMETTTLALRYDYQQVAAQLEKNGLTREILEKSGNLNELLHGRKTGLLNLSQNDGTGTITPISGKLYITEVPEKGPTVFIQPERQAIRLPNTFLGHELSDKDKINLTKTGEMGRVVELKDKVTGQLFSGYVGLDTKTNSLTVIRQERFQLPSTIKGTELTPQQMSDLKAGQPILVKNMTGLDNKPFNAVVQISAAKRSLAFTRMPEQAINETQQKATAEKGQKAAASARKKNTEQPGKTPVEKKDKQAGITQKVATESKNGASRVTVDKTQGSPTKTEKENISKPVNKTEITLNGKEAKASTKKRPGMKVG